MADDKLPPVALLVNHREYSGWKSVRVTRTIRSLAGSFALSVSERWRPDMFPWPIREEDACIVTLDKKPVITGYVDSREQSLSASEHAFSVSGRDRAAALIDNSAGIGAFQLNAIGVLEACRLIAKPFDIQVSLQPGMADPAISTTIKKPGTTHRKTRALAAAMHTVAIAPGDSGWDVIDRICRLVGVLPVSDGAGGILLTRAGSERATTMLIEGENVLRATARRDGTERYRRYVVVGQGTGRGDDESLAHIDVSAADEDLFVRRGDRMLIIRQGGDITRDFAAQVAAWEKSVRAARALTVGVTVQGWAQADGTLWPINAMARIHCPAIDIVRDDMLITEATYAHSVDGGTTTELTLVPKDALNPAPPTPAGNT